MVDQEPSGTLPAKLSVLPERWIDRIFGEFEAFYGALFLDRWRGTDVLAAKRVWASRLATFSDDPACYARALDEAFEGCKLPPTLPEFAAICRRCYRRPEPAGLLLDVLPSAPEVAAARFSEFKRLLGGRA